jgi:hypothetical protein
MIASTKLFYSVFGELAEPSISSAVLVKKSGNWWYWRNPVTGEEWHAQGQWPWLEDADDARRRFYVEHYFHQLQRISNATRGASSVCDNPVALICEIRDATEKAELAMERAAVLGAVWAGARQDNAPQAR